ncbi:MAG: hypothetical protein HOC23_07835 [Halieaceae bacterium]|jgi:hypothetical protein|nr:hypothetical protein [Halieaceae bacterium]
MPTQDNQLLAAVLDELVPPREELGLAGAGRPEVVNYVLQKIISTDLAPVVDAGLDAVSGRAKEQFNRPFQDIPAPDRAPMLEAVETEQPFFIPVLLLHAYPSYYQQADVLEQLDYEARPPFPKGYEIDIGDEQLLQDIRDRVGHKTV